MATIIIVHGTFARPTAVEAEGGETELQWWETGSTFDTHIRKLVESRDGQLNIVPFVWSGNNSEVDRREAGEKLVRVMRDLETKSEPYCVVGHSHGGSVISSALLSAASRKKGLPNLKRWITIGTPFLGLRKELFLLTRLNLMRKVIFVASMMLLLMFLVYMFAIMTSGDKMLFGGLFPRIRVVTAVMMSLPAIIFYIALRYLERRSMLAHNPRVRKRTKENFGPRWLSLAHPDDEAIQGLSLLPDAKLAFFDRTFAVSAITLLSVVTLPIIYFAVLFSPPTMVALADWLKTEIYDSRATPEAEAALKALREELALTRKKEDLTDAAEANPARFGPNVDRREIWRTYRERRHLLEAKFPNIDSIERGIRFKQRFFQRNGQPCPDNKLCGGGRDLAINSGLLLHVVTDELSWALGAADVEDRRRRWFWSLVVPAVMVPVILGAFALVLMLVIKVIATIVSRVVSDLLNRITNSEVKRAAFGNDTEGEVALGATDRPVWLDASPIRLPEPIAGLVSNYSNQAASLSIAKFRRAIGQITFADPRHSADSAISTYFTWKELVHASYFDVPEFRKLVAQAITRLDGFNPSDAFRKDRDFARSARWLDEIESSPKTTEEPADQPLDAQDAKAVAAVVGSTVKAEP
ncbi:hypothetical protein DLM45_01830 [Hyphomicrobium methylovorum]|uniref:alpha/beta hydrolase n=1 Tax=Hyphomicrobium methylovorum TaxID=84 RepID=UPI0015E69CC5|nr:hypothetical protein [Hyphomicrobium methylovorum]MBA2124966.1 hypothetical protein [Hyphomicrobium methylovorum]